MDKDEKLKFLLEQSITFHTIFISLRNKLFVGQIVVMSAICYFLFTWVESPANYSNILYNIICWSGILCTSLLFGINIRMNNLIWDLQNNSFKIEMDFLSSSKDFLYTKVGPYGSFISEYIKQKVQKEFDENEKNVSGNNETNNSKCKIVNKKNKINQFFEGYLNPLKHTGAVNWIFIFCIAVFVFFLLFRKPEIELKYSEYKRVQNEKLQLKTIIDTNQTFSK